MTTATYTVATDTPICGLHNCWHDLPDDAICNYTDEEGCCRKYGCPYLTIRHEEDTFLKPINGYDPEIPF